ncbi:LamG-like jellyroll fold domain-containing protein [Portibacter marinus]|uniref:LamG-like jellyroll fold domain-containing protein n=1 Tax=Portibacter marinus TaxID=2898660 RepID=UPI001F25AFE8|nr:LamG-like jellyroll fold domain-containing protein [Portibacter marinus]
MRRIAFCLLFFGSVLLSGQTVYISFDDCLAINSGNLVDPEVLGDVGCDCGVEGESISLQDSDSALEFDSSYTDLFQEDFTLSFYFMIPDDASRITDIFSVSSRCRVDSTLTIKYLAQESTLRVQMARDFDLFVEMDAKVNTDQCWHQVVVVRDNENYALYLDGQFFDNDFTNGQIRLDSSGTMAFAKSPCQSFGETPFMGKIDEFKIYDRALTVGEIFADYRKLDHILTSDTTIFSGTSVQINQTKTCSDDLTWFPTTSVNEPLELEPIISPSSTTMYGINYNYGICRGRDTISIAVIDSDAVECDNLLIPNAFTPNNDGLNDRIGISNAFIIEELRSFEIFDRWGERVFSTNVRTDQWDGTLQDQKLNPNVFLYKVNYSCKGEDYLQTGSLTILR